MTQKTREHLLGMAILFIDLILIFVVEYFNII